MFLYCNVSTLNPMVGIVITSSSSASFWSLYRIVVLPALSNPRMSIRTSFEPKSDWKTREKRMPMVYGFSQRRRVPETTLCCGDACHASRRFWGFRLRCGANVARAQWFTIRAVRSGHNGLSRSAGPVKANKIDPMKNLILWLLVSYRPLA